MRKDTLNHTEFIHLNTRHCEACWECVEACPHNVLDSVAILWHRHAVVSNAAQCTGCMMCVRACPYGAIAPQQKLKDQRKKVA